MFIKKSTLHSAKASPLAFTLGSNFSKKLMASFLFLNWRTTNAKISINERGLILKKYKVFWLQNKLMNKKLLEIDSDILSLECGYKFVIEID